MYIVPSHFDLRSAARLWQAPPPPSAQRALQVQLTLAELSCPSCEEVGGGQEEVDDLRGRREGPGRRSWQSHHFLETSRPHPSIGILPSRHVWEASEVSTLKELARRYAVVPRRRVGILVVGCSRGGGDLCAVRQIDKVSDCSLGVARITLQTERFGRRHDLVDRCDGEVASDSSHSSFAAAHYSDGQHCKST